MKSIKNSLFIAYRYLMYHKMRTCILVVALSIIIFVPLLLDMVVNESQKRLNTRAESTPLILGEKGSSLDLAINSLYFIAKRPGDITMADIQAVDDTDMAYSIPLYTRFSAGKRRIVGTTLDYVDFRRIHLAQGRMFTILGEAVIGSKVADDLNLTVGDKLISSPENLFDLAGQYPLQMNIVGILAATGTSDDEVIITDIATTWVMTGLCHGHKDLAKTDDETVIIKREKNAVIANAKLKTYMVITPDNIKSFHFHGDQKTFPATSAIVVPNDEKSKTILLGRYQGYPQNMQLIQPKNVVQELILSILRIKRTLDTIIVTVSLSTMMTIVLVFLLSIRLREKEIKTIFRLGCSRMATSGFIAAEIIIIGVMSITLAGILFMLTWSQSDMLIKKMIS
ncbi:MAG: ABC transporter permease [Deltaproteobacteria bacterium]|nr:ABC transporter permease [Deltaproteobacteria bacterium]